MLLSKKISFVSRLLIRTKYKVSSNDKELWKKGNHSYDSKRIIQLTQADTLPQNRVSLKWRGGGIDMTQIMWNWWDGREHLQGQNPQKQKYKYYTKNVLSEHN
jgi:hypothetical protein